MKSFFVFYWKIGASKASCGLEPATVRARLNAENEQKAIERVLNKHSELDEGNIIKVEEIKK